MHDKMYMFTVPKPPCTAALTTCRAQTESVKDLIRYLRHEDDTRDVRQQLGAAQILQNDLLPIITQHSQDKPLFDACIRYPYSRPACHPDHKTIGYKWACADPIFSAERIL